jgi:hypothetical protein
MFEFVLFHDYLGISRDSDGEEESATDDSDVEYANEGEQTRRLIDYDIDIIMENYRIPGFSQLAAWINS